MFNVPVGITEWSSHYRSNIRTTKILRIHDSEPMVVLRTGVQRTGRVTSPVSVVKTLLVSVAVRFSVAVVVRVPTNIVVVVDPGHGARRVSPGFEWQPNPTIHCVVPPNTVVVCVPTPGIVRYPVPTVGIVPRPIPVLKRFPIFLIRIGNPETISIYRRPPTETNQGIFRGKVRGRGEFIWISYYIGRRRTGN